MSAIKMYALKYKSNYNFQCTSSTQEGFEAKIDSAFWRWKGVQARGSMATMDDFLSGFEKVIVTVEPYNKEKPL